MVVIKKLSVQNIRSHDSFVLNLSPTTTVITGKNGSGKTSLLEALHLSLRGSSFKGGDGDILSYNSPWWRIDMEPDDHMKRTVTYNPSLASSRKKFVIDDKTTYRMPVKYKYPVVLFEPDDLRLLHGSPNRRRRFIDSFVGQLDMAYSSAVGKYERALRQRNNLLKQPFVTRDELFVWDVAVSEYGAYIIEKRIAFIEKINKRLNEAYNAIAKSTNSVSVHYSHTYIGDIKQKILNELYSHIERDKILGCTSIGPHRHDMTFHFDQSPALDVASRGEVRSIVLALKFLEIDIIEQVTGQKPVILLDDVFSELDDDRQKCLMDSPKGQIIITSAHTPKSIKDYYSVKL